MNRNASACFSLDSPLLKTYLSPQYRSLLSKENEGIQVNAR